MHYRKAKLMGDDDVAQKILDLPPGQPVGALRLGRKVENFDSALWDREKMRVVSRGTWLKFTRPEPGAKVNLRKKLLATGTLYLVEATTVDRIWGIGFVAEHAERNSENWGENRLGLCLMAVRDRLAKLDEESSNTIDARFAKKVEDADEDADEPQNADEDADEPQSEDEDADEPQTEDEDSEDEDVDEDSDEDEDVDEDSDEDEDVDEDQSEDEDVDEDQSEDEDTDTDEGQSEYEDALEDVGKVQSEDEEVEDVSITKAKVDIGNQVGIEASSSVDSDSSDDDSDDSGKEKQSNNDHQATEVEVEVDELKNTEAPPSTIPDSEMESPVRIPSPPKGRRRKASVQAVPEENKRVTRCFEPH
ncbi:hypothetical protein LQW54_007176 [Pestalotiopsis sp. IQ-011]